MSKRKREAIEKAASKANGNGDTAAPQLPTEGFAESSPATTDSSTEKESWTNRWSVLSFQTKLLTVSIIGLLALGTFGAGLKYLEDSARRDSTNGKIPNGEKDQSLLSRLNPFSASAPPTSTPTPLLLSKEYIYAGSRLLAVEDSNASAVPPADLAIWRPSTGVWWVMGGSGSQQVAAQWGTNGDKPVPGDYDGDSKTDFSIFRSDTTAHTGTWYVLYSATNSWTSYQFGSDDDKPAPADYDGDGKTDAAVWRASSGVWYIYRSSDGGVTYASLGASGDAASPADYDGDGKADIAVWRDSNKTFYSINSSNQAVQTILFTTNNAQPVSADYDGDGKADFAIRAGSDWIVRSSSMNAIQAAVAWQSSGDKAVHNDYDGDGKCDIAVWKDATGTWYIRQSSKIGQANELRQVQWGQSGDTPVPAFYRR